MKNFRHSYSARNWAHSPQLEEKTSWNILAEHTGYLFSQERSHLGNGAKLGLSMKATLNPT